MSAMSSAFTKAYEVWETDFRAHPEQFMTAEQTAAMEVLPLSEQRTICFEAILNTLANGQSWESIGAQ